MVNESERDPSLNRPVPPVLEQQGYPVAIEPVASGADNIGDFSTTQKIHTLAILADVVQTEGFKIVEEYKAAIRAGNDRVRKEAEEFVYSALSSLLYAHSNEQPHALILCECADGRNGGGEMFSKEPGVRFPIRWKPMAGLMAFPRVTALLKDKDNVAEPLATRLDALLSDEAMKKELFDQAETLFGRDIRYRLTLAHAATLAGKRALGIPMGETDAQPVLPGVEEMAQALKSLSGEDLRSMTKEKPGLRAKVAAMGTSFPTTLEFQSHGADGHENHGCGAHGSLLEDALTMSAMNALVLERFLKERYPELGPEDIRISLTHHLNGRQEKVVDVYVYQPRLFDRIDPSIRARIAEGERFRAPFQRTPLEGIVRVGKPDREGKFKRSRINLEEHDEYIIRVSEYHKATGLSGASVLEQSMLPDLDQMEAIVLTLIGIAQKNRIARDAKRGKNQPLFLRLDEPADNPEMAERYDDLDERLRQNPVIRDLLSSQKLFIVRSRTNAFRWGDENSLKTEFLD